MIEERYMDPGDLAIKVASVEIAIADDPGQRAQAQYVLVMQPLGDAVRFTARLFDAAGTPANLSTWEGESVRNDPSRYALKPENSNNLWKVVRSDLNQRSNLIELELEVIDGDQMRS